MTEHQDHDDHDHHHHDHAAEAGHAHGPGHSHSHGHSHGAGANAKAIGIAALLTGGFMFVEIAGGLVSGSLALLADAGHMLTDFAALIMAFFAIRFAQRPADASRTYGFDRLSVLAAFVNGIALLAITVWIVVEAISRLNDPHPITGGIMLAVAVAGLFVNMASFWVLSRGDRESLNLRAAILHVAGDLLGSAGAIVAALVIITTGWTPIDPILSVFVALLIVRAAWNVIRESAQILLEGTPPDFDAEAIGTELKTAVPAVVGVRHIHAWSLSESRPMVTLEAVLTPGADADEARRLMKARLAALGYTHATIETITEGHDDGPLPCAVPAPI